MTLISSHHKVSQNFIFLSKIIKHIIGPYLPLLVFNVCVAHKIF